MVLYALEMGRSVADKMHYSKRQCQGFAANLSDITSDDHSVIAGLWHQPTSTQNSQLKEVVRSGIRMFRGHEPIRVGSCTILCPHI